MGGCVAGAEVVDGGLPGLEAAEGKGPRRLQSERVGPNPCVGLFSQAEQAADRVDARDVEGTRARDRD